MRELMQSCGALFLALAILPCATAQKASRPFEYLYRFAGAPDASDPDLVPPLAIGTGGVIYGVTNYGGTYNSGAVYSLTPPALPGGAWTEAVLHGFGAPGDGSLASSGLALGNDGILYGTTAAGGAYGNGTVFSLAPPLAVGGAWTETVLYSLGERADDGAQPYGTPALGEHGVLYATTTKGGPNVCSQGNCGTVFSLTPPSSPGGAWTESILYAFRALDDGDYPSGTLSIGHDGSLYGTTLLGGESGFGTAFRLAPPSSPDGEWTETILHSFGGGQDGTGPAGNLALGAGPVYYGTTQSTVYSLTPPTTTGAPWTYAVLADDLLLTYAGAAVNTGTGALYGATFYGGSKGGGSIFMLVPPATPGGAWTNRTLHSFTRGHGSNPVQSMLLSNGALYGTTPAANTFGGTGKGYGTVFSFVLAP